MYKPDSAKPEYPIFTKVNGRILPFLSLKAALCIVAALAAAILLYNLTGRITYSQTMPLDELEAGEARRDLTAQWAALRLPVLEEEIGAYIDSTGALYPGLSGEERQRCLELQAEQGALSLELAAYGADEVEALRQKALANGIEPGMERGEAAALAPTTKTVPIPRIPAPARFGAAFLIVGLVVVLVVEPAGTSSLGRALLDLYAFTRKQHTYLYRRSSGTGASPDTLEGGLS